MREITNVKMCELFNTDRASYSIEGGEIIADFDGEKWLSHETPERDETAFVWRPVG